MEEKQRQKGPRLRSSDARSMKTVQAAAKQARAQREGEAMRGWEHEEFLTK